MRVDISFIGLLLLPFVVGCEGNSPRRSPFAATSTPTAAKAVEYAPVSKSALPVARPAGQGNTIEVPAGVNPNAAPVDPPAANPAANGPITIDANKLDARRQLLNYHTAIFLKKEVGGLTTTGINENNNFVFRPAEGLNKLQIGPVVYGHKAEYGKAPQTVQELKKLIGELLTELQPNQFYVYDPELVTEPNKEEMLYLQQYP